MRFILRLFINSATLILLTFYLPGISVSGWDAAIIAALILGLVNAIIRPILIILTLPINIITLGLFTLVINAFLFWLVSTIVKGFAVVWFWPAFLGALILSLVSWVSNDLLKK